VVAPRDKPSAIRDDAAPLVLELRDERMRRGLTQEALAWDIGVQACQLSQWERGLKDPGLRSLMRWCGALGLAVTAAPAAGV
jgi:transcriptional regulator with XRE-family HTH domain